MQSRHSFQRGHRAAAEAQTEAPAQTAAKSPWRLPCYVHEDNSAVYLVIIAPENKIITVIMFQACKKEKKEINTLPPRYAEHLSSVQHLIKPLNARMCY